MQASPFAGNGSVLMWSSIRSNSSNRSKRFERLEQLERFELTSPKAYFSSYICRVFSSDHEQCRLALPGIQESQELLDAAFRRHDGEELTNFFTELLRQCTSTVGK